MPTNEPTNRDDVQNPQTFQKSQKDERINDLSAKKLDKDEEQRVKGGQADTADMLDAE